MGRSLGDPDDPLLVSVRSGAKFSMPGMMETVLDIGLNDESVLGLARASGSERFAFDSYRRLLQMFGATVLGIDADGVRRRAGQAQGRPRRVRRRRPRRRRPARAGGDVPGRSSASTPATTSRRTRASRCGAAVLAVFSSWHTERAVLYRRQERIPDDLGTAVNVQAMVFGNRGTGLGLRRLLHPRPGDRLPRRVRRLPRRRPGRGRRRRASATRCRSPTSRASTSRRTTRCWT